MSVIDILNAARDLRITQEEVEYIMYGVFRAAIVGGVIIYMIRAFGKGVGLREDEHEKITRMAESI